MEQAVPAHAALLRGLGKRSLEASLGLAVPLNELFGSAGTLTTTSGQALDSTIRFRVKRVDLESLSPSFPGATVVADRLVPNAGEARGAVVELDTGKFLAYPVLRLETRQLTIAETLARALGMQPGSSESGPRPNAWVFAAALRAIAEAAVDALQALWAAPLAADLPILAHHVVGPGSSIFVSRETALRTPGLQAELGGGLTWAASLRLAPQRKAGRHILYEVGDVSADEFLLSVGASGKQGISCLCRLDRATTLEVAAEDVGLVDGYVRVMAAVHSNPQDTRLLLWADDRLVGAARCKAIPLRHLRGSQVVGAGLLGRHGSAFFLRELVLIGRPLTPPEQAVLSLRMQAHAGLCR